MAFAFKTVIGRKLSLHVRCDVDAPRMSRGGRVPKLFDQHSIPLNTGNTYQHVISYNNKTSFSAFLGKPNMVTLEPSFIGAKRDSLVPTPSYSSDFLPSASLLMPASKCIHILKTAQTGISIPLAYSARGISMYIELV